MTLRLSLGCLCFLFLACASSPKGFDKEGVRRTLRGHIPEVRLCYEAVLERDPKIEGKLLLRWTIDSQGKATDISPVKESSTLQDERLITCITDALATWQFEKPPEETTANITYPFYFRKTGEE